MPFLIDGHNLIGAMPDLHLADPDDEARLVERLQRLALRTGRRITVVFDRGAPGGARDRTSRGGVTVRFAPSGVTADALLIRILQAERNPRGLIVVSSNRRVQEAARRRGAQVWSSPAFVAYLRRALGTVESAAPGSEEKPEADAEGLEYWLRRFRARSAEN